jgi:enoyl-CoA hydratase/carnithine racemase
MPSGNEIVTQRRADGVRVITIDRPQKHNALARSVLAAIAAAVDEAGSDTSTRLIVLTGAGDKYFAAGGDLHDLSFVRDKAATHAMADEARLSLDTIRRAPVPVVAALNGDAIGGGAELALACDLRLQAAHARIGFIQAKLAITSAWGGGSDLFRLVGGARAVRMMSRAELIDARQALEWGLADAILTDGVDGSAMQAFLEPMVACAPQVLRGIKAQAIAWRFGVSADAAREVERQQLIKTWLHDDHWAASDRILARSKR